MTNTARVSRCGLIFSALALSASPLLAAPTPQEIMKRAESAMNGARSYSATYQMNMTMGQMGSMSMNMNIQTLPHKKMKMTMTPNGQPTGMMAMGAASMNMMVVDDGKNFWMYMPAMKMYQKRPSQMNQSKVTDVAGFAKFSKQANLKLLRTENLNGRPAYVIQVVPKNMPPQAGKQTILIYIDQATNRFKQMRMTGPVPAGPNQPPQQMSMTMVVKSETLNAPIPASAFTFSPPPGAKEMKGGPMGGMGMPGPMGGGSRR